MLGPPAKLAAALHRARAADAPRPVAPVRVRLQSRRSGVGLDLVGSTPIEFSDYGMEPPSVAGVASVRDHGRLEVRLRLR